MHNHFHDINLATGKISNRMILSFQCRSPIILRKKRGSVRTDSLRAEVRREERGFSRAAARRKGTALRYKARLDMARPKKDRLPGREFHTGGYKTTRTPHFTLKFKNNQVKNNRIGVVVGVAVHKSAVKRNFWKRQVLETLTRLGSKEEKPRDFIIIILPQVNKLTKRQFREKLLAAVK